METELAWAAGLFDGEGSIGFWKNGKAFRTVRATIYQKDRKVLDRFFEAVECGKIQTQTKRDGRVFYTWRLNGLKKILPFESKIHKHLSPIKQEQFNTAIEKALFFKACYNL